MFLDIFAIHKSTAQVTTLDSKVDSVIANPVYWISPYLSYAIINVRTIEAIIPIVSTILAITIRVASYIAFP